ncbi:CvfB family protein [Pisciglobus halotolerans]|uniref:S1 motif domain-containing protein n=1 Tax=Pisciglobus halotolerans TaxID=745365 RepID=A0A1I3CI65_9LACT|nr:S1-like domain-containing RNA-binding protein [Pisciglobus halotolerans]SFH74026.1 hypothetical protein SAMN04489868_11835 [Pisciglobus halotolerans]
MNHALGQVITGIVTDENEKAYFVQKEGLTYQLAKEEVESLQLGDTAKGFAYISQNKLLILTTHIPKVRIGHYAFGEVVEVRKDLGVFVAIGLPDKELVVSLDDLPSEKHLWPKKGDTLMLSMKVDEKDRMWGVLADDLVFQSISRKPSEEMLNKDIKGVVYRTKLMGTHVLTDDYLLGFIHPSERDNEPRLGERVTGRVIGIGERGMLNISLKPRAHEVISEDAAMLLTVLERSKDQSFSYTDKSSPESIKEYFGISKGQFKRALGNLMKQRKVIQKDGRTYLVSNKHEDQ